MKKVLVISYYWPPSGGAGVQRWLKFSKYLPEFGWKPVILTVREEDASYAVIDSGFNSEVPEDLEVIRTPSREIFSLYKKFTGSKHIPNAGFASEEKSGFKQKLSRFIRGNFFLPDPRKGWNKYAFRAAAGLIAKDPSITGIITTSPPHSTQLIGLRLKKKFNIPWLADLRDPWTDIYYYKELFPTIPAHRINLQMERRVLRTADRLITVGPELKQWFAGKHRLDPGRIGVIHNGYDEEDFKNLPEADQEFVLTYVGTLSDRYTIDGFIDVLAEIASAYPSLRLRFVGSVSEKQKTLLNRINRAIIEYHPHVSHREALEYMSRSSMLLLVIPEHKSAKAILTGKLFEYLAVKRPILGIGPPDGDASAILEETGTGMMYAFNDRKGIREYLLHKLENRESTDIESKASATYSRRNLSALLAKELDRLG